MKKIMKKIMNVKALILVLAIAAAVFVLSTATGKSEEEMTNTMQTKMTDAEYEQDNTIYMTLKDGVVTIKLFPDVAPNHTARIKKLIREGFYDGVSFHRVIDGFMAQTGDPTGTGRGGSNNPNLKAEFNDLSHTRGAVSMARANDPDSANSQFFIVLQDSTYLDKQYTVFGRVTEGMEYVDMIRKGDSRNNGMVTNPDKIIKIEVLSDIAKQKQ